MEFVLATTFCLGFFFGLTIGLWLKESDPEVIPQADADEPDPADYWKRGEPAPDWNE